MTKPINQDILIPQNITRDTFLYDCAQTITFKDTLIANNTWYAQTYRYSAYAHFILGATIILGGIAIKAFAAVYLPLTMISLPFILDKIRKSYANTMRQANDFLRNNKTIVDIDHHYRSLKVNDNWRTKIKSLAPDAAQESLKSLLYLYAYYKHSIDRYDAYDQSEQRRIAQIRRLPSSQERSIACAQLAKEKQMALKSKVEAAFMLAVMKNPGFTGNPKAICDTLDFDWAQHMLGCDDFLTFRDKSIRPLSSVAVDRMSPGEISEHILTAMQRQ